MVSKKLGSCVLVLLACGTAVMAATVRDGGDPDKGRIIWADPFDWYTKWAAVNSPNYTGNPPNPYIWQGGPTPAGNTNVEGASFGSKEPYPVTPAGSCLAACPVGGANYTGAPTGPAGFGQHEDYFELARDQWQANVYGGGGTATCGYPFVNKFGTSMNEPGNFQILYGGGGPSCGHANPADDKCYSGNDDGQVPPHAKVQTATTFMMQAEADYTWGMGGSYMSMTEFTRDLTPRIQAIASNPNRNLGIKNAVKGTDADPLVLVFQLSDMGSAPDNMRALYDNSYVELSLEDATAPLDYIWMGDTTKNYPDPDACPQGPYPVVCQADRTPNPGTGCEVEGGYVAKVNARCPAVQPYDYVTKTGKTWNTLAFGFLAILDKNPCAILEQGCDGHKPTNNHFAVFDGNRWRSLGVSAGITGIKQSGTTAAGKTITWPLPQPYEEYMEPDTSTASIGDFSVGGGMHTVYVKVRTNDFLIYMNDSTGHWGATVPRAYLGAFNKVRWGAGPGCQLKDYDANDPTAYACDTSAGATPFGCLTYARPGTQGYDRTGMDSMSLFIGTSGTNFNVANNLVFVDTIHGGCCMPDGTCPSTDEVTCGNTAHSLWWGVGVPCGRCCPYQYGDFNNDGFVDMNDFAVLQSCLTMGTGSPPMAPECTCVDSEPNGNVNDIDVAHFITCAAGANVPPNPLCKNW